MRDDNDLKTDDNDLPPVLRLFGEADEKITGLENALAESRAACLQAEAAQAAVEEKITGVEGALRQAQLDLSENRAVLGRLEVERDEATAKAERAEKLEKALRDLVGAVDDFGSAEAGRASAMWRALKTARAAAGETLDG